MRLIIFAGLLVCAIGAQAQPVAPATAAVEHLGEITIKTGSEAYPNELAQQGVHGKVKIEGLMQVDGKFSDLKIVSTSRSETLDKNALVLAKGFRTKPDELMKEPKRFTLLLSFTRDNPLTLKEKSCADFIADFDYFRKTFAELPAKKMAPIEWTSSLLLALNTEKYFAYHARENSIIASTVEKCRANPDHRFMDTMMDAIK
jgi:TonB family protein